MTIDPPDEVATAVAASYPREAGGVYVLTVAEGPERGESRSIDGSLPAALLVGQSPVCDFRLTDPHVSRRHVALDLQRGRVKLVDLGSTNGTRVDGVSVGEAYLGGGEEIRIGGTVIRLERRSDAVPAAPPALEGFGRLYGKSPAMQRLYPLLDRLARSHVVVIIEGETGTGKEVVAEALHEAGPRAAEPYVVFDCTTVPATMVEAELFGHERGAFTGAVADRKGAFEQAHGGTLLIDEIGDLELSLQSKLLRALDRGEIRRIGGARPIRVDVRVLAATRRDLDGAVQVGRFRDDLFHRLAVARVELPPLRERAGDVALLASRFWADFGAAGPVPGALLARWEAHDWPGNVRELRNAVARHLALGDMTVEPLPPEPSGAASPRAETNDHMDAVIAQRLPLPLARAQVLREFERRYIESVLAEHDGNVAKAAEASGIARRYFQLLRSGKRRT